MSDAIVFHHKPSFLSLLGIVIILSSAIYVAVSAKKVRIVSAPLISPSHQLSKPTDLRSSSPREADEEEVVRLMPLTQEDDNGGDDNMEEIKQPRGGRGSPSLSLGKDVKVTEGLR